MSLEGYPGHWVGLASPLTVLHSFHWIQKAAFLEPKANCSAETRLHSRLVCWPLAVGGHYLTKATCKVRPDFHAFESWWHQQ